MPIKRMRYVRQPTHLVDAVHRLLGGEERRNAAGDEETDDLAFQRLDLFPSDRELGSDAHQIERAFDRVVVGQRNPVEATFVRPDRKSTRLNSSHVEISYAVFCLKK